MIYTDGNPTVATAPRRDIDRSAYRKRAKILRAFYSACSAYPGASFAFLVSETAKSSRVSERMAERVIDAASA